jgi:hypothetical protein
MNEVQIKVKRYKEIYSELKNNLRWKVSDSRILMMAASLYVTSSREFSIDRFNDLSDFIKSEVGMFSTLKGQTRFTIAAMLDTRFEIPKDHFSDFLVTYEKVIAEGFSRGIFSYITAMVILSHEGDKQELASLSKTVFKKMREEHFFLTGQSDYPLAVLLAQRNQNIDELITYVEDFYNKLDQEGFRKGNDLQSMSHILSLQEVADKNELISRCTSLYDALKAHGIRPKAMFYPQIALLSFLSDSKAQLPEVKEIWEALNEEKLFKWHKDTNFMMAVTFFISDKIEHSSVLETSLYTTIEALIQAQQAASIAAISSAAVAANSADGS